MKLRRDMTFSRKAKLFPASIGPMPGFDLDWTNLYWSVNLFDDDEVVLLLAGGGGRGGGVMNEASRFKLVKQVHDLAGFSTNLEPFFELGARETGVDWRLLRDKLSLDLQTNDSSDDSGNAR